MAPPPALTEASALQVAPVRPGVHVAGLRAVGRHGREVQVGQECGMAFENYDDMREGDVIEIFETETVERQLA